MGAFIEISAVSKTFETAGVSNHILSNISLDIAQGEFVCLIGHSGCGKSTLLNMIGGLTSIGAGFIEIQGQMVRDHNEKCGYVFQNYSLLPWLSVWQNVYEAVDSVLGAKLDKKERKELVDDFLKKVNLWPHKDKMPRQLSGGMKQRVAIARAFAVKPEVLLLDEPFGALDALTKNSMHEELLEIWRVSQETKKQTVVMVTHDIDESIYLADRVVVMTDGPGASIACIVDIPIERPRSKLTLLHHPKYMETKEYLLSLLTNHAGGCLSD